MHGGHVPGPGTVLELCLPLVMKKKPRGVVGAAPLTDDSGPRLRHWYAHSLARSLSIRSRSSTVRILAVVGPLRSSGG